LAKRKKIRVYAFRGQILKLEERIARCKSKLDDPKDPDDMRWLARWLKAAERRLVEKERSLEVKNSSRKRRDTLPDS
jgi:predicted  nucleic acid-binding Zn-ribbon protein